MPWLEYLYRDPLCGSLANKTALPRTNINWKNSISKSCLQPLLRNNALRQSVFNTVCIFGVTNIAAVSGEAPQNPVASVKSGTSRKELNFHKMLRALGNVFEKRLIESYISENGKDPVTGEDLTVDDLVELKSSQIVRPRPPALTSIPSLLSTFQNEWDALALESYTLRQHLTQTRQELSRALYEQDAAVRVIARLSKERDEAREALSKVSVTGGRTTNGDAMQVDGQELPESLVTTVKTTQERYAFRHLINEGYHISYKRLRLSKTRRKRAIPNDWATPETLQSFTPVSGTKSAFPGSQNVALDASGDLVLFGGRDGKAGIFSIRQDKLVQEFQINSPITDVLWVGGKTALATSAAAVKIFENGVEAFTFSGHAGEVTALALHPSGEILASVGVDKTYIFYDLTSLAQALQVITDSGTIAAFIREASRTHANVSSPDYRCISS